jgi:hypothetical protein
MAEFADRLALATSNLDDLSLADLADEPEAPPKRGSTGANLEPVKHGGAGRSPRPDAATVPDVVTAAGSPRAAAPTRLDAAGGGGVGAAEDEPGGRALHGGGDGPGLALDLEALGPGHQTQRMGSAEAPVAGVVHTGGLPSATVPAMSVSPSGAAPRLVDPYGTVPAPPIPAPAGPLMASAPASASLWDQLSGDVVVLGCVGFILGLSLSIVPAVNAAERVRIPLQAPLLEELELSVKHPLSVAAGERRAPDVIQSEIRAGYPKVVSRYYGVWLGLGLPLGAVLALLAIRFLRRS